MSGRLPYKTGVEHGSQEGIGSYSAPEYALALSANFSFIPATLKKAGCEWTQADPAAPSRTQPTPATRATPSRSTPVPAAPSCRELDQHVRRSQIRRICWVSGL